MLIIAVRGGARRRYSLQDAGQRPPPGGGFVPITFTSLKGGKVASVSVGWSDGAGRLLAGISLTEQIA
jgi:hypothetical protein